MSAESEAQNSAMSGQDDEEDVFPSPTLVLIAIVSLIIYFAVLRPKAEDDDPQRRQRQANRQQNYQQQRGGGGGQPQHRQMRRDPAWSAAATGGGGTATNSASNYKLSEAAKELLTSNARYPPHVDTAKISKQTIGGTNVLVDGIVAFQYMKNDAKTSSATTGAASATAVAAIDTTRKDRAKVLSKLLASAAGGASKTTTATTTTTTSLIQPPARGSTIVIALQETELKLAAEQMQQQQSSSSSSSSSSSPTSLQRVVQCLSEQYNVFCMVHVTPPATAPSDSTTSVVRLPDNLTDLFPSVPKHRFIVTSTSTGRIAFVRQLQSVEWVIDFDQENQVQNELSRFGYKVYVYDPAIGLGDQMIPE